MVAVGHLTSGVQGGVRRCRAGCLLQKGTQGGGGTARQLGCVRQRGGV